MAIEHALTILSWHENLPSKEVPPEHLWEDPEGLEQWWKHVDAMRDDGVETQRGRGSSNDSDDGDDRDPGPQMVENDHARFLKNG